MSHRRIQRFDSISTIYSDQMSLFDDPDKQKTAAPTKMDPPKLTLTMPTPPPQPPTPGPLSQAHLGGSPHNETPNSTATTSNPFSSTPEHHQGHEIPQSAPIIQNEQPDCELLNHQSFIQASKPGIMRLRSVSFKKPQIVVPKPSFEGYHNMAYAQDDSEEENNSDNETFLAHSTTPTTTTTNTSGGTNTFSTNRTSTTYHASPDLDTLWNANEAPPSDQSHPHDFSPEPELPKKSLEEEMKEWDRFETLPPPDDDETVDSEWVKISIQWLKIAAYVVTFLVVLFFAVVSKSLILLMTSMVKVNQRITLCNQDKTYILQPALEHDKIYTVQYGLNDVDRVAWLWALYFAIVAPYVFALGRSLRICYFKSANVSSLVTLLTVFCMESLHCIGLSILAFMVLPNMDAIKGAMLMNSACTLPSILRLFVQKPIPTKEIPNPESKFGLAANKLIGWFTFSMQALSLVAWTVFGYEERDLFDKWYLIPVALILVSFEWWENYLVPKNMHRWLSFLENARKDLEENKSRYFVSCFVMTWKILLIFAFMILNEFTVNKSEISGMMFRNFTDGFNSPKVSVLRVKNSGLLLDSEKHELYVLSSLWPLWILLIHLGVTYICYAFAKFTCKVCIQEISFAIPVTISVPVTVSVLWALKNMGIQDKCQLTTFWSPSQYIFWNMGTLTTLGSFQYTSALGDFHGWMNILVSVIWFLCLVSQITNTLHIWKETSERLASTEQLFVAPMYNSVLIDQSLAMNRRSLKLIYSGEQEELVKEKKHVKDVEMYSAQFEDENKLDMNNNHIGYQNPLYQSFSSNRKKSQNSDFDEKFEAEKTEEDWMREWAEIAAREGVDEDGIDSKPNPKEDDTIRIFACATMWHEDKNEMLQMLKAIMRLDKDQWARRKAREDNPEEETMYYEIETNIFFDDAYEQGPTDDEDDRVVNRFVEQLIDVMNEAANHVLEMNVFIDFPTIVPTPYGGKLIWKLPGENRLIAHVKDKNLIRHRKRWSQCMYMYYLLGYRLAARHDLSEQRKRKIANNTFVLALDGDINFQPDAVHLVVDLMKKNSKLGAVCGRIHPIGGGPIVWYQKFEYAVGHWLQKATEHVFGCVLCSPGCFSLFRARAVMSKSVMHKYTLKPSEALHYVQYDQGEDRWLCTLMLQQGWRIEYCAASDSYTHAPEGFGEFYTQRRRWAPSTMANIMDLLGDYKQTIERNENISLPYILYQAFLMVGTILSPGTIFLMIISALNTAMNFNSETSLLINVIPILAFTFVCLQFKDNDIKINFAMMLSLIYALLMLAVLVGTGIDMFQQGFLSPNSLFFSLMMGSFLVAAIIHPQEFSCVLPLPIYWMLIPSMYLLLTIYSVTNMHIVAWGTREVKSKLSAKEMAAQKEEEEQRAAAAAAAAAKKGIFSQYMDVSKFSSGSNGFFTCMCCAGSQQDHGSKINDIHSNVTELKTVVNQMQSQNFLPNMRRQSFIQLSNGTIASVVETPQEVPSTPNENTPNGLETLQEAANENSSTSSVNQEEAAKAVDNEIPRWIRNNKRFMTFKRKPLHERELHFWKAMITKYLLPLDEDAKEKKRISDELIELRNRMVFAFAFMNIIFILFVFMLQLHKDVFGIDIPVGVAGYNRTYNEDDGTWDVKTIVNYTRMDPISIFLVVFFGSILIIQLIGMFIHRFGTLAHLLAYTKIELFKRDKKDITGADWVKKMIQMTANNKRGNNKKVDGDDSPPGGGSVRGNRKSQFRLSDMLDKQMDKIETDTSRLEKMPSLMRKNTIHAMKRRETKRKRQPSFTSLDRSDTFYSDSQMSFTSGISNLGSITGNRNSNVNARPTLEAMKSYNPPPASNPGPTSSTGHSNIHPTTSSKFTIVNSNTNTNASNDKHGSINQLARDRAIRPQNPPPSIPMNDLSGNHNSERLADIAEGSQFTRL